MDLFDKELNLGGRAPVFQHANVFQTDKGVEDAGRLGVDEGSSIFDGHTSKTGMPSFFASTPTPRNPGNPR